jgi:MFS family permease
VAAAVVSLTAEPIVMVLGAVVLGAANAAIFVPAGPFMMDNSGDDDRLLVFSTNFAVLSLGSVIGSLASGFLPAVLASGFGLEAAARRFGLAFVPIAEERYLFACRRGALSQPGVQRFRELLAGATTRRIVATLAGYALDGAGRLTDPAALRPA